MVFGMPLGTLGAHLVVLWCPWGLLWEVFGVSFGGLLAPLGHSRSLGESWGGFWIGVPFGIGGLRIFLCILLGMKWGGAYWENVRLYLRISQI